MFEHLILAALESYLTLTSASFLDRSRSRTPAGIGLSAGPAASPN